MTASRKQMKMGIMLPVLTAMVLVCLLLVGCAARPSLTAAKPEVAPTDEPLQTVILAVPEAVPAAPRDPGNGYATIDPDPPVLYPPTLVVPPPTVPTLLAPHEVLIRARGGTSIRLQFLDRMDLEDGYYILRGPPFWEEVQALGVLDQGWYEFEDPGLEPDTLYCYRVKVTDGDESDLSPKICARTRGAEARPIFRAQLEITTASFPEAATSQVVSVRLNSPGWAPYIPNGNITYLDHGRDDFRPGSIYAYDLTPPRDLHDITLLMLDTSSDDKLCVARLRLILNRTDGDEGVVVFDQSFGDTPSTCRWLGAVDNHEPFRTVFAEDLRANPSWPHEDDQWCGGEPAERCPIHMFNPRMSYDTLTHRLEGMIGHMLCFYRDAYWRPGNPDFEPLTITYIDERTALIKIRLKGDATLLPDPKILLRGVLRIQTRRAGDGVRVTMALDEIDANVDFSIVASALGVVANTSLPFVGIPSLVFCPRLVDCLEAYLEGEIEDGFNPISERYRVPGVDGTCARLHFESGAGGGADVRVRYVPCDDLDVDAMPDDWEEEHGLDPDDPSDALEDPDGDGFTNDQEFMNGTDPLCHQDDRDCDLMPNDWEEEHGLDPDDPSDALENPDFDKYLNFQEYQHGTDPHQFDW